MNKLALVILVMRYVYLIYPIFLPKVQPTELQAGLRMCTIVSFLTFFSV